MKHAQALGTTPPRLLLGGWDTEFRAVLYFVWPCPSPLAGATWGWDAAFNRKVQLNCASPIKNSSGFYRIKIPRTEQCSEQGPAASELLEFSHVLEAPKMEPCSILGP